MEIYGQGFTLRGWRIDDAAPLQKHADNNNISSYLLDRFPHPYTMDNAVEWITLMMKQHPLLNFVIDVDGALATYDCRLNASILPSFNQANHGSKPPFFEP